MEYLYILREALVWIITIFWLYQLLVSLCSLVKIKDKPLKVKKDHRFMAIIPAHNEEAVVGNLIESLKNPLIIIRVVILLIFAYILSIIAKKILKINSIQFNDNKNHFALS